MAGAGIACLRHLGALIGASILYFTRSAVSTLEVQSDPEGAKVLY